MVHKIDIFNKNPAMSKMIPSTIMAAGLSVSRIPCGMGRSRGCATLAPVHHHQEGQYYTPTGVTWARCCLTDLDLRSANHQRN